MRTQTVDKAFFDTTKQGILIHYADTPHPQKRAMAATASTKKHCSKCAAMGRSERAITSHDTASHKDFPPRNKVVRQDKVVDNKDGKNYCMSASSTPNGVWDPGATTHFWKTKPKNNYRHKFGKVQTASGDSASIVGEGEDKLGDVKLANIQHVPSFTHDLVSGVELMKDGHEQTLTPDGFLTVKKRG